MFICQRRGNNGAGGIVAGDGYHRNTVALRANPVADNIARVRGATEPALFRADSRQQGIVPVIGIDIDQLGGRGVGVFPVHFTGQAVAEIIGHQQRMSDLRR